MNRLALALAVVACGCTSFDSIDRGVCGNGLIEAAEDCDSSEPSCVRCAVVCSTATDCPTTDYACGVDGLCHAPGGALGAAMPAGPFQINDLTITDIDRDRIGDVVGVSKTSIAVRYGEPTARLSRSDSVVTPSQVGDAAFGDLDDDGTVDLTIATPDGLVAYGSRFGAIAPIPVGAGLVDTAGNVDIRHTFHIGRLTLGAFVADTTGTLVIAVVDFLGTQVFEAPCLARLGPIPAQAFSSAVLDVYAVDDDDLVVSFLAATTPRKLCVIALHKPLFAAWTLADITPANAGALARRPVLADLENDSDRCPGLVNTDAGAPGLRYWDGSMTAAGCTLQAVVSPLGTALPGIEKPPTTIAVGRIPLSPGFGATAADLLVLSDGVYGYTPGPGGGFGPLFESQRRLAGAAHGDLDGDSQIDGVLIAETEDDIEVFYRRPNAVLPLFPGYVVLRLDTASRVVATELGDYDGNGRLDIALIEQLTDHQRLSVAYGTTDLLLPPRRISAFSETLSMSSLGLADSDDAAGVTDDLVVLQPPRAGTTATVLTILSGSVLRTMTPYFDPRADEDPDGPGGPMVAPKSITQLRGVMVGRFFQADTHRDPIAVMIDTRPNPTQSPQLWPTLGTAGGPDATPTLGVSTMGLADCVPPVGSGLCVRDATFFAWPISGTRDTVIAVDRANPVHVVAFDPGATGTIAATEVTAITSKLPAGTMVRSMHPADLDGDGTLELVVAAVSRLPGSDVAAILVCDVANGVPSSCEDLAPAIVAATQGTEQVASACIDAAPARIAFRDSISSTVDAQDLVVICRDAGSSLYRVHRGEAGLEISVLARTQARLGAVRIGDVTGDGIDDVVALEGDSGAQSLVVFAQCSSRNLAACARGSGGGS
jgi:hypothetical protein